MSESTERTVVVTQIDNWAAKLPERQVIEDFFEYLTSTKRLGQDRLIDIHFEKELDEYHQVDRRALDKERRGLLRAYQELTEVSSE